MLRLLVPAALLGSLLAPAAASACSVCGCGDPLVAAGDAMPVSGNFRVALEGEGLTATAASDEDPTATESIVQYTLRPVVVYSLLGRLNLVLQIPVVRKDWALSGAEPETHLDVGLGDLDLGGRFFFWQHTDLAAGRRQNAAVTAGTSLPTGPNDAQEGGARIDDHAQLGTGSFGPYAGLLYAFHQDPWNASVDVSGRFHTANGYGYRYGPALMWTARGTFRPWERLAFSVALDGRMAGFDDLDGEQQVNTGGLVLAATPGVSVGITDGLWLHAQAQVPVYTALHGTQTVGPVFAVSLQYSFAT
ncbi:MAG TPA: hypothetical protein VIG99_00130 [Myxococcaceae bacterium]|jgi:hypothetical protein